MKIDDLLKSTKPILYETGTEEWPYAFSGTCYPVKYEGALFIVSAFHCYSNVQIEPENTLYPRPDDPTGFFAFDTQVRAHATHMGRSRPGANRRADSPPRSIPQLHSPARRAAKPWAPRRCAACPENRRPSQDPPPSGFRPDSSPCRCGLLGISTHGHCAT